MNFEPVLATDFTIPPHKEIYILGGGISLDLFDKTQLDRNKHIIISCNGTISYPNCPPHFQICNDAHAIPHWSKHKNATKDVLWVCRYNRFESMQLHKLNYIKCDDIYKGYYGGTGAAAFALAVYISTYSSIDKVYYIGFDFTSITIGRRNYWYANTSECMDYQLQYKAPSNWKSFKYSKEITSNTSYNKQLQAIAMNITTHKEFCKKLVCLSAINVTKLNYRTIDSGYNRALTRLI